MTYKEAADILTKFIKSGKTADPKAIIEEQVKADLEKEGLSAQEISKRMSDEVTKRLKDFDYKLSYAINALNGEKAKDKNVKISFVAIRDFLAAPRDEISVVEKKEDGTINETKYEGNIQFDPEGQIPTINPFSGTKETIKYGDEIYYTKLLDKVDPVDFPNSTGGDFKEGGVPTEDVEFGDESTDPYNNLKIDMGDGFYINPNKIDLGLNDKPDDNIQFGDSSTNPNIKDESKPSSKEPKFGDEDDLEIDGLDIDLDDFAQFDAENHVENTNTNQPLDFPNSPNTTFNSDRKSSDNNPPKFGDDDDEPGFGGFGGPRF